jgi:hypothetical protein
LVTGADVNKDPVDRVEAALDLTAEVLSVVIGRAVARGLSGPGTKPARGSPARLVGTIDGPGIRPARTQFSRIGKTDKGTDVLLANDETVLPSQRPLGEVGLKGCKGCADSAIATDRNLSGNNVTANEVRETRGRNATTDHDVLNDMEARLGPLETKSAPTFEKALNKLARMPGTRGVAVMDIRGASEGHVINFQVDAKGNVRLYDSTGDLGKKLEAGQLNQLVKVKLWYKENTR